ncbi:Proteasome maturation factor UMP1 [Zea mays]|uniref:Proteasome maturation factor UMP1 n=1 Tax=Zea mays TaxID=4577 RepID=A0A1D6FU43_MAIZE|nr:Proteasome maturation factor UMP1 [Zea mays]
MQSSSMKREISEAHDTIRFGINAGVKADLAPPHPLQSTIQSVRIRRSPPFPFVRAHETLTMSMGLMWGGGRLAQETKFWADKKKFGTDAIYGSALNIRKDLDAQILSRFQRPPGALPSSLLGYEALTGSLDDFGFEDYLNMPHDSDSFRQPDMHHGMEVRLGLSKGPICPSFN